MCAVGEVLLNMLRAHTAAYKAIRALPNGGEFKVTGAGVQLSFGAPCQLGGSERLGAARSSSERSLGCIVQAIGGVLYQFRWCG